MTAHDPDSVSPAAPAGHLDLAGSLALLDLSSDLVLLASPSGAILRVNRAWCETLGYHPDDVSRVLLLDTIHPDHAPAIAAAIRDAVDSRCQRRCDTVLVTRDGAEAPVEGWLNVHAAPDDTIIVCWVMRDTRPALAAAMALSDTRAQFASVFEHATIGMAVLSLDGRWQAVNPALCAMLGYAGQELLEMTFHDITYPDDLAANVRLLDGLIAGETSSFTMDKRYLHRDGHLVSVVLTVSAVAGADGRPLRLVAQMQDVTERRQLETRLTHKASHDVLTSLPNRALFMDRLEHALARRQRDDGEMAVMFVDLDDFKAVNDQFGHEFGDQLLVEVGRRLRACARAGDTVARFGGDEFTVLLERLRHPSIATQIAQRIGETLRYPVMIADQVATISPSIGIALGRGPGERAEDLLRDADTAMYEAKRSGKGRAVVARRPG